MRPHSPGGERGHESVSRRGALRLLSGGGFHQRLEVPVNRLLLEVDGLCKAAQKHRRSGDVMASPSELWGIIPPIHDVALDLAARPERRSPGYAHGAQRAAPSAPAQVAAGSTAFVVAPRYVPRHTRGHPHEGLKGCGSIETLPPPVAVLRHLP